MQENQEIKTRHCCKNGILWRGSKKEREERIERKREWKEEILVVVVEDDGEIIDIEVLVHVEEEEKNKHSYSFYYYYYN